MRQKRQSASITYDYTLNLQLQFCPPQMDPNPSETDLCSGQEVFTKQSAVAQRRCFGELFDCNTLDPDINSVSDERGEP